MSDIHVPALSYPHPSKRLQPVRSISLWARPYLLEVSTLLVPQANRSIDKVVDVLLFSPSTTFCGYLHRGSFPDDQQACCGALHLDTLHAPCCKRLSWLFYRDLRKPFVPSTAGDGTHSRAD